jgi:ketosteroid isomerase-like protein
MSTTTASENADSVRRGYAAFQRGDLEALRELFSPDIRWHTNGRNLTAGTTEGVDATLERFRQLAIETGGTFRVEIHDLLASEEHVVVLASVSADRGGRHLVGNYAHVFHLSGGKVTECWVVNDDPYAQDEFFA